MKLYYEYETENDNCGFSLDSEDLRRTCSIAPHDDENVILSIYPKSGHEGKVIDALIKEDVNFHFDNEDYDSEKEILVYAKRVNIGLSQQEVRMD